MKKFFVPLLAVATSGLSSVVVLACSTSNYDAINARNKWFNSLSKAFENWGLESTRALGTEKAQDSFQLVPSNTQALSASERDRFIADIKLYQSIDIVGYDDFDKFFIDSLTYTKLTPDKYGNFLQSFIITKDFHPEFSPQTGTYKVTAVFGTEKNKITFEKQIYFTYRIK